MSKKTMIDKLTPEQEAYLPEFREEWRSVGLSTGPINEDRSRKAVIALYAATGLEAPEVSFHVSPMACLKARHDLLPADEKDSNPYQATWTSGCMDAYWLAFYEFGRHIGAEYTCNEQLDAYIEYAKASGIMYAYEGRAFVSHWPEVIKFDENRLLHSETGLAVEFSDGFGVAAWHGVRVPREWVLDKTALTPTIALKHENMEQRKAACEILGWENVLKDLDHSVIDKHDNPAIGELLEVDLKEAGVCRFVRALCGTGRMFCFEVNPKFNTVLEANADTYDIHPKFYEKMRLRT